jgi:bifunctional non-homologous end joining protein LigD
MSLLVYRNKRDFSQTPEPVAEKKTTTDTDKRIFVVQRHKSSILHYDLRLEVDGVLKSWAIPKGPSMNCSHRRVAVITEDHPLSYAAFKGVIPEGNYGAGIVERWDKGTYVPHNISPFGSIDRQLLRQIRDGVLKFTLKGKKLKGVFTLVRINGPDSRLWLLIKGNDKFAVNEQYDSENYIPASSLINKIIRQELLAGNAPAQRGIDFN